MQHGYKKWCEEQAIYWREQLGLPVHAPLPAEALAKHLGIGVIYPHDIPGLAQRDACHLVNNDPESWSAVTVSANGCTAIISNPSHSQPRREADIMHELGHIIRGHEPALIGFLPWFPLPLREFNKVDEKEAEWLGGCLQIPRPGLVWAINRNMTQRQIASHFGASYQMARFRYNVTGIEKQRRRRRRRGS